MTALDKQPVNRNFFNPLGFQFSVRKLPHVNFFLQEVTMPDMSLSPPSQPTPFVVIPHPGDHIDYGTLEVQFIIDEDFKAYYEIHNWIRGLGWPTDYSEYDSLFKESKLSGTGEGLRSDVSVMLGTNLKNPNIEVVFIDAFPTYIGGFRVNTTDNDVVYLTCPVQFKFTYFDISTLPK